MKKLTTFIKKHPWLLAKSLFLVTFFSNILVACLKKSMLVILDLKGKDPNWEPPVAESVAPTVVFTPDSCQASCICSQTFDGPTLLIDNSANKDTTVTTDDYGNAVITKTEDVKHESKE